MKKYIILAAIIILAITAYTLIEKRASLVSKNMTPIKIGTILSETGIASAFGENAKHGAELAVEEINRGGGINGRMVTLVTEDDRTDPKTAVGLYKKLTSIDNVDAIIGSNFDFVVNPLFAEAEKGSVVVISPTSPRIAGALDTNKNSFTMLSDFSTIVSTLDTQLTKTPYSKIAVIHYNSAFGKEVAKTINTISVKNGKGEVSDITYDQFGIADWTPYILAMKKARVDLVFADMLGGDFAHFAVQARRLGFEAKLMTHMDVREALNDKKIDTTSLEGTTVLNWDALGTDQTFSTMFKSKYNREADHFAAQSYVAVYVLANAIAQSNTTNETVSSTLESQTFKTPLGEFGFSNNHTISKTKVKVQEIKDRKLIDIQVF